MPQMNKGGKFIFGESVIRPDGRVRLPTQAVDEYHIASEGKVYLFTGSKITGGFCVTRQGLLLPSKLGHILTETPSLLRYEVPDGTFLPYKGRSYCWTAISETGEITLTERFMFIGTQCDLWGRPDGTGQTKKQTEREFSRSAFTLY